jgi:hypothetical protein
METRVSRAVRRVVPAHCGHLSAIHSCDHWNQVSDVLDHDEGSPVVSSKCSPDSTASRRSRRNRSASARVLNERVRSRPSIRHLTRYRRFAVAVPFGGVPSEKTWTRCGVISRAPISRTAGVLDRRPRADVSGTGVVQSLDRRRR